MARAQVCRFYDDGTSGTALRRPIKRLPEFQTSAGLFYSAKGRRTPPSPSHLFLHIPRNAIVQLVFILFALFVIMSGHSPPSPTDRSPRTGSSDASAISKLNALASRTVGSTSAGIVRLNIPEDQVKPGVSLAAVCMGRHETVKKTVPAWLKVKDVNEIILVDWSSDPPLERTIREIPGGERIKIIRVNGESTWILSRAYNLAVNATSFTHIIRTDCDYQVSPGFVAAHEKLIDTSGSAVSESSTADGVAAAGTRQFYAGNYKLARNENEVHLNGAVYILRKDFLDVGGYDERIQTYGWDDEDLYTRLNHAGLKKMNISYDHVSHVQHGNSGRAQSGVKFAIVEIDLNAILLAKLKPWSKRTALATEYSGVSEASSNSVVIEAKRKPKALRDLVTQEEYDKAWGEALGRRLHDSYFIAWDIIASLELSHKERLLRKLMHRSESRERAKRDELDAAGRQSEVVDANTIPTPRVLICHCMHGLGNRLRALGSCMSFAKETNRELIVIWQPDSHIEARFSDMYTNDLVILEKLNVKWPFADVEKWDPAWLQFKFHNYMEMEGMGAVKGEKIVDLPDKHMYYKGAYIIEVVNPELTNWEKDNAMLKSLNPIPEVQEMVKGMESRGLGSENVIGLHVRNRTLEKDIKNVDFVKEYGEKATNTMDMWRHKSGVQNFIKQINVILKERPEAQFFVATDTFELIGQLEKIYGQDRILSFPRICDDRDGTCVRYALADLYALSKCKELYGSNWSSFTEVAQRLGGVTAKLAGRDFAV